MVPARRQYLGPQLVIADLVWVQAHGIGHFALSVLCAAEGQERSGADLMGGVVARPIAEDLLRAAQHVVVVATLVRGLHLRECRQLSHGVPRAITSRPARRWPPSH